MQTEDHSKNEIHYVELLDRPMSTRWIKDQEQSAVTCCVRTNPRLPGMLGSATRISSDSGLQNTTTRVASATGDRRNANIGISAGVSKHA